MWAEWYQAKKGLLIGNPGIWERPMSGQRKRRWKGTRDGWAVIFQQTEMLQVEQEWREALQRPPSQGVCSGLPAGQRSAPWARSAGLSCGRVMGDWVCKQGTEELGQRTEHIHPQRGPRWCRPLAPWSHSAQLRPLRVSTWALSEQKHFLGYICFPRG